jgi:hypothetical protein
MLGTDAVRFYAGTPHDTNLRWHFHLSLSTPSVHSVS